MPNVKGMSDVELRALISDCASIIMENSRLGPIDELLETYIEQRKALKTLTDTQENSMLVRRMSIAAGLHAALLSDPDQLWNQSGAQGRAEQALVETDALLVALVTHPEPRFHAVKVRGSSAMISVVCAGAGCTACEQEAVKP